MRRNNQLEIKIIARNQKIGRQKQGENSLANTAWQRKQLASFLANLCTNSSGTAALSGINDSLAAGISTATTPMPFWGNVDKQADYALLNEEQNSSYPCDMRGRSGGGGGVISNGSPHVRLTVHPVYSIYIDTYQAICQYL